MTNKKNKQKKLQHNLALTSLPYEVKTSSSLGRYLVASKNISYGETIITEEPIAVGPALGVNRACCIGCFIQLDSESHEKCEKCNFPVCKENCTKYHSKAECDFFKEKSLSEKLTFNELFDLLFPLKVLFLKTASPEKFEIVQKMEAHIEERKLNKELWEKYQHQYVSKIQSLINFSEEEIQFVLGVIDVNCFELGDQQKQIRALYPSAFLMSHECVCNTRHTDDPQTNVLKVMACRAIRKGESITINYGYTLQGTLMRRQYIYEGKYFWCTCKRCSDPTELRTYISALVCKNCEDGKVLPVDSLDQGGSWNCNKCSLTLQGDKVSSLLRALYNELEEIGPHNVKKQEEFLSKYKNVLGANHYLFLSAKYSLCQILGKMDGYVINELSEEYLRKKETYCRQLLAVVGILEPGNSRLRGMLLYELHAPIMVSLTRQIQEQKISVNKFKSSVKEVVRLLTESFNILKLESEGTGEYEISIAAKQAVDSMT
ncbi:hypothetical protein ACFFRR_001440 [Megaselia abdita]